jgi:release factor glutamine methyltransferase
MEMVAAAPTSLRDVLAEGIASLRELGIESARLDAELLLREASGRSHTDVYLDIDATLSENAAGYFRDLLARRRKREPVAYITGKKEFWSLDLLVTPDVLVPRPETERVVEVVLEFAKAADKKRGLRILDIGTGSGAIALALASELPDSRITATDVSLAALEVGRKNSERLGLSNRLDFRHGDLFGAAFDGEVFDLIVSNPPYIRSAEFGSLAPEIRHWEPLLALDGGKDGLDFYRRLAVEADRYLVDSGFIVVEIGADMAEDVLTLFARTRRYSTPIVYADYAGHDRVVVIKKL